MKIKMERSYAALKVVTRLNSVRMKSSSTARRLFGLKKLLEPNFEFYAEEERKLILDLGGTISEDGDIIFPNQEEGIKKLSEGRKELMETEMEIPIDTPIVFHDNEGVQVSGEEIGILDGLAEFKE